MWERAEAELEVIENGFGATVLRAARARSREEALEEAARKADRMAVEWGILRSLKMTHYAQAAEKVASAIRDMGDETLTRTEG